MAKFKEIGDEPVVEPVTNKLADETADLNARIKAEVAGKIKSRSFSDAVTVGKAGLFDISKHSNGIDYTAGGMLECRWCRDDDASIAGKRKKGFMFPSDVSGAFQNIRHQNMVLMVRTTAAADNHRQAIADLSTNLDGQEFDAAGVAAKATKINAKAGKAFRDFSKIEA